MKKILFSAGAKKVGVIIGIAVLAIFLGMWFAEQNLSANNIKISFETFGGDRLEDLTFDAHNHMPSLPKARKDGYYFEGWFADKEYTQPIKKLNEIKKSTRLYAKFTLREYTILYHYVADCNPVDNPESYTVLSDDIVLATPSRTGFLFLGWYANDRYVGEAVSVIKKGAVGNLNLYARWWWGSLYLPTVNLCQPDDWSSFIEYTLFDMAQVKEPLSPTGTALKMHLPVSSTDFNGAGRARVRSLSGVNGNTCTVRFMAKGEGNSIGKKVRIYTGAWHTSSEVLSAEYKLFVFENVTFSLDEIGFAQGNWALGDTMFVHSPQIELKTKQLHLYPVPIRLFDLPIIRKTILLPVSA